MTDLPTKHAPRRWWPLASAGIGLTLLAFLLWRIDFRRFIEVLAHARVEYLALVPIAVALEQLVRAWKWRQILLPLRPVGTLRLFGAIMSGYLGNILIPFGVSSLVRSWLIARLERLRMSAVLATVAIDRLIDGIVFAFLVAIVLILAAFPDPTGNLRLGLGVAATASMLLFVALLLVLGHYKRGITDAASWMYRLTLRLPVSLRVRFQGMLASFADGIIWPRATWRRLAIVLSSVTIKLIATTHFLWAGLAFGIVLRPLDYLFLIVFLGFVVFLTRFIRLTGGFIVGAIFALGLFGVREEQALAMVLVVEIGSLSSVAAIGCFALWREGVAISDLRYRREQPE